MNRNAELGCFRRPDLGESVLGGVDPQPQVVLLARLHFTEDFHEVLRLSRAVLRQLSVLALFPVLPRFIQRSQFGHLFLLVLGQEVFRSGLIKRF